MACLVAENSNREEAMSRSNAVTLHRIIIPLGPMLLMQGVARACIRMAGRQNRLGEGWRRPKDTPRRHNTCLMCLREYSDDSYNYYNYGNHFLMGFATGPERRSYMESSVVID